jgi:hypothetical protein
MVFDSVCEAENGCKPSGAATGVDCRASWGRVWPENGRTFMIVDPTMSTWPKRDRLDLSFNHVTKPYAFMGFGAMDVTKPYDFIGFGAMDVTKPYEFIWFLGGSQDAVFSSSVSMPVPGRKTRAQLS